MMIDEIKGKVEQLKRDIVASQNETIKALQYLVQLQADRIARLETDLARAKAIALAQVYHPIVGG